MEAREELSKMVRFVVYIYIYIFFSNYKVIVQDYYGCFSYVGISRRVLALAWAIIINKFLIKTYQCYLGFCGRQIASRALCWGFIGLGIQEL